MKFKAQLERAEVGMVMQGAINEAKSQGWIVSVAVVDDGGHLLEFQRLDGCAPLSASIAVEKARAAALGRKETKLFEEMINNGRTAFLSAPTVNGLLEGGVPIIIDGHVVGAVGVSGVKSNQDAQVAAAGVANLSTTPTH